MFRLIKPAYVDMCILDLGEVLMYEFRYDYIKIKYGNKSILLFTDTDIVMCETKTEEVYKDFSNDKEMLDFSKYFAELKYYDDSEKIVVGQMKMKQVMKLLKNLLD